MILIQKFIFRACDGCLNFEGMFDTAPSANKVEHVYAFDPPKNTNNHGLGGAAISLEKIYKSIDWPYTTPINPDLTTSLHQSGKSRADLWQLAGLVALERTIERANRACDLDFHVRQQVHDYSSLPNNCAAKPYCFSDFFLPTRFFHLHK